MTLAPALDALGFDDAERLGALFGRYRERLKQWNRTHNLTGYDDDATIERYILDALYPATFLPPTADAMDIGTGAGFPGLMLAAAMPETRWVLVEPLQKRAAFLQFVAADLQLQNVTVERARVERLAPRPFDLITSRAVTETAALLSLSEPFHSDRTMLLFYKGEKVYDELPESMPYCVVEAEKRRYLLINPPKEFAC